MGFFSRRFWEKKGWDVLPKMFVNQLKRKLGVEKFAKLDQIAQKYNIFNQKIFEDPAQFEDDPDFVIEKFSLFLGSMANQLAQHDHQEDAETLYHISLTLKSDENPSHGGLAVLYFQQACYKEASEQAQIALNILDEQEKRMMFEAIPEEIAPAGSTHEIREILINIIDVSQDDGNISERDNWGAICLKISINLEEIRNEWFKYCVEILMELAGKHDGIQIKEPKLGGKVELAMKAYQLYLASGFIAQNEYVPPSQGRDFADVLYAQIGGNKLMEIMGFVSRYDEVSDDPSTQLFRVSSDIAQFITGEENPLAEAVSIAHSFPGFMARGNIVIARSFGDEKTANRIIENIKSQNG